MKAVLDENDKNDFDRMLDDKVKEDEKFPRVRVKGFWNFNWKDLFDKIRRIFL